jgi:hypothetical protein
MEAEAVQELAVEWLGCYWPTQELVQPVQAWFVQHEQGLEPV